MSENDPRELAWADAVHRLRVHCDRTAEVLAYLRQQHRKAILALLNDQDAEYAAREKALAEERRMWERQMEMDRVAAMERDALQAEVARLRALLPEEQKSAEEKDQRSFQAALDEAAHLLAGLSFDGIEAEVKRLRSRRGVK